ncbi:carboxypeptidase-like regulatory domain-containing protein [Saccharicrinis sp. GN24d3]|uniref:carboxypeptidase-like regulatory domain-containing protein n=1 Tax=Saccharicrinis sp. GN24d3 TaxID=3458416 RepID=UPI0040362BE9
MKTLNFDEGFIFLTLIFLSVSLYAQENDSILLKGIIVDTEGQPLPGAQILESGTTNGTSTNIDGYFELKVPKGAKVNVSFVGMTNIEIENVNFSNIKVNLSQGLIEFCCINHIMSHCAMTIKEMQKLSKKHKCSFK